MRFGVGESQIDSPAGEAPLVRFRQSSSLLSREPITGFVKVCTGIRAMRPGARDAA